MSATTGRSAPTPRTGAKGGGGPDSSDSVALISLLSDRCDCWNTSEYLEPYALDQPCGTNGEGFVVEACEYSWDESSESCTCTFRCQEESDEECGELTYPSETTRSQLCSAFTDTDRTDGAVTYEGAPVIGYRSGSGCRYLWQCSSGDVADHETDHGWTGSYESTAVERSGQRRGMCEGAIDITEHGPFTSGGDDHTGAFGPLGIVPSFVGPAAAGENSVPTNNCLINNTKFVVPFFGNFGSDYLPPGGRSKCWNPFDYQDVDCFLWQGEYYVISFRAGNRTATINEDGTVTGYTCKTAIPPAAGQQCPTCP